MILEIAYTIAMAGVAGYTFTKQKGLSVNEAEKIKRICINSGLTIKDNGSIKTIRIHRKRKIEGGTEYVYQLPLGMSEKQIQDHKHIIQDGLNVIQTIFDPLDILRIKWNRDPIKQIKRIINNKKTRRKEIDIEFDGMLKIKVFDEPIAESIAWTDDFIKINTLEIPIGRSRTGIIYHDFTKSAHMIVAGSTGFGKSQFLKMLITTLIMADPDHVHFDLIDLKGGTAFQRFRELKQVDQYGKDPKEGRAILEAAQSRMGDILDRLVNNGFEDCKEAGIRDHYFIIIDEAADIAADKTAMEIVSDIARRGRGANYHLIYCTQYPTNETIPSQVRPNIGARVCFRLKTNIQSRAVLDEGGAEELQEIPGRGIYQLNKNIVVQSPYMTNEQIKDRITPYIRIRPRKDDGNGQKDPKTTADRKHTLIIEKI